MELSSNSAVDTRQSEIDNDQFLFLNKIVTREVAEDLVREMIAKATLPPHLRPSELILFINSPGGDAFAAIQIIDAMLHLPIPVITYGSGSIASAALLILMSGTGTRVATNNSILMTHQFATGNEGKHHELLASQKEYTIVDSILLKRYKLSTGKSESYIRKHLLPAHDVYLTAEEALTHKIIDQVVIAD